MSNNHRQLRALDTNRLLKSYREMSNNALKLYGADNAIVSYQNKKKVHTILVPATWKLVYAYAVVNALAVTAVRFAWDEIIGKPVIEAAYEDVMPRAAERPAAETTETVEGSLDK